MKIFYCWKENGISNKTHSYHTLIYVATLLPWEFRTLNLPLISKKLNKMHFFIRAVLDLLFPNTTWAGFMSVNSAEVRVGAGFVTSLKYQGRKTIKRTVEQ